MQSINQSNAKQIVIIVDPYSTGGSVSVEFFNRGFQLIALWTDECAEDQHMHVPADAATMIEAGSLYLEQMIQDGSSIEGLATRVRAIAAAAGAEVFNLVCGGETGVKVADALSEHMGLRSNGTANGALKDRRDKSIQQERVRASGMRACREALGTTWAEVASFCETEAFPIVVKPVESAGSDGVKMCSTVEEARAHFELLMSSQRKCGATDNAAVLLQEFLRGTEYVVDSVTRDGVHKTTMVWVYDKRAANGSAFVYYDMLPVPADTELARSLIAYARGCIDALEIKNGATHTEVMMTNDGPCLVEVNCRCHGGNGAWLPLASRLTGGVTQVGAFVDAFVDGDAFARVPDVPQPFRAGGCNPMFVSHREGAVRCRPGYEAIRGLRSFVSLDEAVQVGQHLVRTIDLFTSAGQCILVHDDPKVVAEDVATIRAMELDGSMFDVEGDEAAPAAPPAAEAAPATPTTKLRKAFYENLELFFGSSESAAASRSSFSELSESSVLMHACVSVM